MHVSDVLSYENGLLIKTLMLKSNSSNIRLNGVVAGWQICFILVLRELYVEECKCVIRCEEMEACN